MAYLIHLWHGHECWRCGQPGRVLLVFDNHGYGNSYIEERKLGEAIRNKYPFFSPSYSATMEMVYYANHCVNALCGVLQGDHYVLEWTMSNEKHDKPDVVEKVRR